MWEDILIGVAGGIVYAFLALATREWLVPKIRELTYEGVVISGTWEAYFDGIEEPAAVIDFKQHGRNLSGVSQVTRNTHGERVDRRYRYSGRFLNRSLVFTFEDLNNPNMFGGSMVFHAVNSDGTCMNGAAMFYKPEANDVVVERAQLWKKGARPIRQRVGADLRAG